MSEEEFWVLAAVFVVGMFAGAVGMIISAALGAWSAIRNRD